MPLEKPNYTQIPNVILDEVLPHLTKAELKVVLAICRRTFGYHDKTASLSLTDLQRLTGLTRSSTVNALKSDKLAGWLVTNRDTEPYSYNLVVEKINHQDGSGGFEKCTDSGLKNVPISPKRHISMKEKVKERFSLPDPNDEEAVQAVACKYIKSRMNAGLKFPFFEERPDFVRAWYLWVQYRKSQHNFQYKSILTEQAKIAGLMRDVAGDADAAIEWINNSISEGWRGIYEPKNKRNEQRTEGRRLSNLL